MSIWHKAATNARGMVIVGTGPAGVAAAVSLRESGWDGTITMIGAEPTPPYERPPLSKASITANVLPGPVPLLDEAGRQSLGITLLSARPVVAIDRASRQVLLASGDAISYQALLIATGAKPRLIKGITCGTTRTHALRTYEDALALRQALRRAEHIVIVGAGLIGLEVASSAVAVGVAVTVIEASDRVMARAVPETLALHVADRHRKEGVAFRFGVAVESIEETAQGARVLLDDGKAIVCDLVLMAIGAEPRTELASRCELSVGDGIRVDETLRTSDPFIFAAGDCASFSHPLYEGRTLRLECWRNAELQGATAGRNMLGAREPYTAVPWFWSQQYDFELQVAGITSEAATFVERILQNGARLVFGLASDGRLVCAGGVGLLCEIAKDIRVAQMLIEQHARPPSLALAEPTIRLRSLAA